MISCVSTVWTIEACQKHKLFSHFSHYESPLDSLDARWLRVTPTNCEKAQGPGRSQRGWVIASSMEAELRKDGVSKNGTLLSIHQLDCWCECNIFHIAHSIWKWPLAWAVPSPENTIEYISGTHVIHIVHTIMIGGTIWHQLECIKKSCESRDHHASYILWPAWCMQSKYLCEPLDFITYTVVKTL